MGKCYLESECKGNEHHSSNVPTSLRQLLEAMSDERMKH